MTAPRVSMHAVLMFMYAPCIVVLVAFNLDPAPLVQAPWPPTTIAALQTSVWILAHSRRAIMSPICAVCRCLAASRQSSLVALGSEAGVVRLVDSAALNLTVVHRARLHHGPILHMKYSPDGSILAVLAGPRWVLHWLALMILHA